MPCQSFYPEERGVRERTVTKTVYPKDYKFLKARNKKLEAALCAVFSELELMFKDRIKFNAFVKLASKRGGIDLNKFWSGHKKADDTRLIKMLDGLSEHEKDKLKELL